jgi:hypothetical protein
MNPDALMIPPGMSPTLNSTSYASSHHHYNYHHQHRRSIHYHPYSSNNTSNNSNSSIGEKRRSGSPTRSPSKSPQSLGLSGHFSGVGYSLGDFEIVEKVQTVQDLSQLMSEMSTAETGPPPPGPLPSPVLGAVNSLPIPLASEHNVAGVTPSMKDSSVLQIDKILVGFGETGRDHNQALSTDEEIANVERKIRSLAVQEGTKSPKVVSRSRGDRLRPANMGPSVGTSPSRSPNSHPVNSRKNEVPPLHLSSTTDDTAILCSTPPYDPASLAPKVNIGAPTATSTMAPTMPKSILRCTSPTRRRGSQLRGNAWAPPTSSLDSSSSTASSNSTYFEPNRPSSGVSFSDDTSNPTSLLQTRRRSGSSRRNVPFYFDKYLNPRTRRRSVEDALGMNDALFGFGGISGESDPLRALWDEGAEGGFPFAECGLSVWEVFGVRKDDDDLDAKKNEVIVEEGQDGLDKDGIVDTGQHVDTPRPGSPSAEVETGSKTSLAEKMPMENLAEEEDSQGTVSIADSMERQLPDSEADSLSSPETNPTPDSLVKSLRRMRLESSAGKDKVRFAGGTSTSRRRNPNHIRTHTYPPSSSSSSSSSSSPGTNFLHSTIHSSMKSSSSTSQRRNKILGRPQLSIITKTTPYPTPYNLPKKSVKFAEASSSFKPKMGGGDMDPMSLLDVSSSSQQLQRDPLLASIFGSASTSGWLRPKTARPPRKARWVSIDDDNENHQETTNRTSSASSSTFTTSATPTGKADITPSPETPVMALPPISDFNFNFLTSSSFKTHQLEQQAGDKEANITTTNDGDDEQEHETKRDSTSELAPGKYPLRSSVFSKKSTARIAFEPAAPSPSSPDTTGQDVKSRAKIMNASMSKLRSSSSMDDDDDDDDDAMVLGSLADVRVHQNSLEMLFQQHEEQELFQQQHPKRRPAFLNKSSMVDAENVLMDSGSGMSSMVSLDSGTEGSKDDSAMIVSNAEIVKDGTAAVVGSWECAQ